MAFIGTKTLFSENLAILQGADSSYAGGYDNITPISYNTTVSLTLPAHFRIKCNRILVEETNGIHTIYVYDLQGNQLFTIDSLSSSTTISGDIGSGRVVIGDSNYNAGSGIVAVYDLQGNQLFTISPPGGDFPVSGFGDYVSVGSGRIVASSTNGRVCIFDMHGHLIKNTVLTGDGPVHVSSNRIIQGGNGETINDRQQGVIYIYDLNGVLLNTVNPPRVLTTNFLYLSAKMEIAGISSGRILATSSQTTVDGIPRSGIAFIFDLDGNLIAELTSPIPFSQQQFGMAAAVGNGRILIADADNPFTLFEYDLDGNFISSSNPDSIAVGEEGIAIGNGKVVIGSPVTNEFLIYDTPNIIHYLDILDGV